MTPSEIKALGTVDQQVWQAAYDFDSVISRIPRGADRDKLSELHAELSAVQKRIQEFHSASVPRPATAK